jgi:hypothetical protein
VRAGLYFDVSKAPQLTQALLRASVVFECYLVCHQSPLGVMTNMVHHLSLACLPSASAAIISATLVVEAAALWTPDWIKPQPDETWL